MAYYKQMLGEKCYLTPLNTEDAEDYCRWLNDLSTTMFLEPAMSLTPETETELIRGFIKGNNKIFGIVDKETDKLIGGVGLHDIDFINGMGMYGIYIGEKEFRGKGYGKEATFLLMDYGFNILNLYNIYLMVFEYNKTAVKCYERWGFNLIGRRRKAKKIAGQRFDIIMMDMLADEFKSVYVGGLVDEAINP